jgi:hypothetical protein
MTKRISMAVCVALALAGCVGGPEPVGTNEEACLAPVMFLRGDANDDGRLDVSDAGYLLSWLFDDGPALFCDDAGDANDDGRLDVSDARYVLDYLFSNGAAPAAPFPQAGYERTKDSLGCGGIPDDYFLP